MSTEPEQFRRRVEELVARFEAEVDRREWLTRRYPKTLRDANQMVYEVPALYLQRVRRTRSWTEWHEDKPGTASKPTPLRDWRTPLLSH